MLTGVHIKSEIGVPGRSVRRAQGVHCALCIPAACATSRQTFEAGQRASAIRCRNVLTVFSL
ncbi:hypothetical protein BD311DRAFT_772258 [Dichomitus squalens]|uniref:Uncharacterized protein n=1 Tax=Dichomitus squalens TaxID=114155 RepID=A0A4Q9M6V0_9APHY|nr:hypothetical protein BD311DRAFT_772258 [Dichomitus squalens]